MSSEVSGQFPPKQDDREEQTDNLFPCSAQQQQFWILDRVDPGNPALNVAVRWQLDGHVSASLMHDAFGTLLQRHEILRTRITEIGGEPMQCVLQDLPAPRIAEIDLTGLPAEDRATQVLRISKLEGEAPFDLASPPLIRATLLRMEPSRYILLVTAHHIVCDGWSIGLLAREIGTIYAALEQQQPHGLPELPLQYGDFALWQREALAAEALAPLTRYWMGKLSGMRHFEVMPDRPRPPVQTSNGHIVSRLLPRTLTAGLRSVGAAQGATLFATVLAGLKALLHRHTGETDIAIGTQVAGRDDAMLEGMIGVFINTLVLRDDASGDPIFTEFLSQVRDTVEQALAHGRMPIQNLVEQLKPPRDPSRNPLFSVNFIFQRSFIANADYGSWALTDIPSVSPGAIYDLNFFMVERPDGWRLSCEFNTDLFETPTVEALLERLELLLASVVGNRSLRLSELPVLTRAERQRLLVGWNSTAASYPEQASVASLWQERAARGPNDTALILGDQVWSCARLDAASRALAARLAALGMGPGSVVGVALPRSAELVVSLLAVMRTGAAYLPLDPGFPPARLQFIAADAGIALVISSAAWQHSVPLGLQVLLLDSEGPSAKPHLPEPENVAYVIYTSGSTGQPKGVANTHRGLVNRLSWLWRAEPYGPDEIVVHKTSPNFVDSVTELLGPLLAGVPVLIASAEDAIDPQRLGALLQAHRVTRITLVPSLLAALLDVGADLSALRLIVCSGEVLTRQLADRLQAAFPAARLMNFYGSSEANGDSLAMLVEPGGDPVPIGRPIANTTAYVLDGGHRLQPVGAPGTLWIGGLGLAAGYLNRPDLTEERFIANPFGPGRLYCTGDIARWRRDGTLEYLGRADRQVKLRGFRIELSEVEAALQRHPSVAEAVVTADAEAGTLRGYVVARPAAAAFPGLLAELRSEIARTLPGYMHPGSITLLDAMPRTATGKIDRTRLARPDGAGGAAVASLGEETERRIAAIWGEVLGTAPTTTEDNFFDLGGHSLLAVRMLARVEAEFGQRIGIAMLFQAPTVRGMAELLRAHAGRNSEYRIVKVQSQGSRTPIVAINNTGVFAPLSRRLGSDQPFYAVQLFDPGRPEELPARSFTELAGDQLRIIREVQPHGPYVLVGLCVAGSLAYEVAQLLTAQGEDVRLLVMLDSWAPGYVRRLSWMRAALAEASYRWKVLLAELNEQPGRRGKLAYLSRRVSEKMGFRERLPPSDGTPWYQAYLVAAASRHIARPYAGRVLLLHRRDLPRGRFLDRHFGWSGLLHGPHKVHEVPGTHLGMFQEPHVGVVAEHIRQALAASETAA